MNLRFLFQQISSFFLTFLLVVSSGCSQNSSSPVIKIGCAAPMTGDQAQIGIDHCRGVQLAVDQTNENGEIIPGYKLELVAQDDQHNPAQAVNVAKKFVSDRSVVGVVGHFNSSCTKPASAVYEAAGLTHITAGSTNPALSRQGHKTFFRVAATDDVQGPQAANFALKVLKVKSVFVIDDKTTYGKGLADEFEKRAKELGLTVLEHEGITQGDKDFSPLLTRIKPLNPDLIYFGGIYPEGALLIRQTRGLGIQALFMGGDGIATPLFPELATAQIAEGVYATMVGGDIKKEALAAQFVAAYEKKFGAVGQWSAYAYDSANILITAIKKAGSNNRADLQKALRETPSFQGVTGEIIFDEKGDNRNQVIGVFQVRKGRLDHIGMAN